MLFRSFNEEAVVERLINNVEARPRLPDQVFSSLSTEDRRGWAGLSKDAKQRIVDLFARSNNRRANVTEITHDDDPLPTEEQGTDEPQDDATTTVTANKTQIDSSGPSSTNASSSAHPGDVRRALATKAAKAPKTATRSVRMTSIRHVGATRRDDEHPTPALTSDDDFSLGLDEVPDDGDPLADALIEGESPHDVPLFDDSPEGQAAWRAEMHAIDYGSPYDESQRLAYQTLATCAADYEGSDSERSFSDDEDAWYESQNSYYDSLDF